MSTREIVTLQIGHYSNFVGSHWWNLQESSFVYDPKLLAENPKEVNHDVLYREGKTLKREVTYTPRLVAFDLGHSLGSLRREGVLYDIESEEDIKWTGDVTLHQAQTAKKNQYLEDLEQTEDQDNEEEISQSKKTATDIRTEVSDNGPPSLSSSTENQKVFGRHIYHLDDEVKVWSDYLRSCLHPRSLHIFQEHQHNNPEQPFNIFGLGQQLLATNEKWDNVEDKIRYFTEECDQLQGFNILFDSHNAFGGVASTVTSYLADEYSNKSALSFSLTPPCLPDKTAGDRASRILNSALSLYNVCNSSSLCVPLSLASTLWKTVGRPVHVPHLDYKPSLDYHTSAILAAAIDTATLPFRHDSDAIRMHDITTAFSSYGRKVCALNASLPFPVSIGQSFTQSLMALGDNYPWVSLTPNVNCVSKPNFHSCVIRGMPKMSDRRPAEYQGANNPLASCDTLDDVLRLYLMETFPGAMNAPCVMNNAMKLDASFPHIFHPNVNYHGFLSDTKRSPNCAVECVPAMTSLQSNNDIFTYIDGLEGSVSRLNIAKHQHFIEAGLDPEDFDEVVHGLKDLAQKYKEMSCL